MLTRFQSLRLPVFVAVLLLFQAISTNSQCCNWVLNMHDGYGDGWNGGHLQVTVNHILVGVFSGKNNFSSDSIAVCTGDSIELFYTAGNYENENSYEIFDHAWNLIFANGPTPKADSIFNFIGDCDASILPGSHPCTAIEIDSTQCLAADNSTALGSGIQVNCANFQGHDVWFRATAPPSGHLIFSTQNGSLNDTGIAAWVGNSCSNLTFLACDDDSGPGYYSLLSLYDLPPGSPVFIQIFGYGGATGSFELCEKVAERIVLDSSELPIVLINTLGKPIVADAK